MYYSNSYEEVVIVIYHNFEEICMYIFPNIFRTHDEKLCMYV